MPWAATSVAAPPTFVAAPPSTRRPNSWRPVPMRANLIHSTAPASLAVRALPASWRQFLKASAAAGAGLVIGFAFAGGNRIAAAATAATADGSFAPNAFIRVAPDNTVTVLIKHIEMGQGTFTGLATLVARSEEHTSELQSLMRISYAVFCLKKKKK